MNAMQITLTDEQVEQLAPMQKAAYLGNQGLLAEILRDHLGTRLVVTPMDRKTWLKIRKVLETAAADATQAEAQGVLV